MAIFCKPNGFLTINPEIRLEKTNITQGDIFILYFKNEYKQYSHSIGAGCDGLSSINYIDIFDDQNNFYLIKDIDFLNNNIICSPVFKNILNSEKILAGNFNLYFPRSNETISVLNGIKENCYNRKYSDIWIYDKSNLRHPIDINYELFNNNKYYGHENFDLSCVGFESRSVENNQDRYMLISNRHVIFSSLNPFDYSDGSFFGDDIYGDSYDVVDENGRGGFIEKNKFFGVIKYPISIDKNNFEEIMDGYKNTHRYLYSYIKNKNFLNSYLSQYDAADSIFKPKKVKFFSKKLSKFIERNIVISLPISEYFKEKFGIGKGASGVCIGLLDQPIDSWNTGIYPVSFISKNYSYLNFSESPEVICLNKGCRVNPLLTSNHIGLFKSINNIAVNKSKNLDSYDEYGSCYFDRSDIGSFIMAKGKNKPIIIGVANDYFNESGILNINETEICVSYGSNCSSKEFIGKSFKIPSRYNGFNFYEKSSVGFDSDQYDFYRSSSLICDNYNIFSGDYLELCLNDEIFWRIDKIKDMWGNSFSWGNTSLNRDDMLFATKTSNPSTFNNSSYRQNFVGAGINFGLCSTGSCARNNRASPARMVR